MLNKLMMIQKELKCNKSQYNSFGKYRYRSCEDILEAVKPLLVQYGCTLTLTDEIMLVGDRFYVKAIARLNDIDTKESFETCAYAREEETKKGQDGSQITGTASSYARKYALNGLFLIDDTKDADTDEYKHQESKAKPQEKPQAKGQTYREKVIALAKEKGISLNELAADYSLSGQTTEKRYQEVLADLEGK